MTIYAIIQHPGHNRVYFNSARILSIKELSVTKLSVQIENIREEILGNVPYLLFDTSVPLTQEDLTRVSRLSFVYAIYILQDGALTPVVKDNSYYFSDDISTILKYTGKTNELFTRFMLNIAVSHAAFNFDGNLNVLDPICGKGTSMFESLLLGYNAYGIEIDEKPAREAYTFFKKYLETAKYKHESHTEKVGGQDAGKKRFTATRYQAELAKNKPDQKTGRVLKWEIVAGDTVHANTYFKKETFHIIIGDMPYGVQHKRNASALIKEALPVWVKVLKPGGVIVLSWNLFIIRREEMEELFNVNGLNIPRDAEGFKHRVDQAIERDVIIGIKK